MIIQFIRPVKGYSYAEGMRGDVDDIKASQLIAKGYAYKVDGGLASDLPKDFPARDLLIKEGLRTIEQVRDAKNILHDIKGIGQATIDEIDKRLKQ